MSLITVFCPKFQPQAEDMARCFCGAPWLQHQEPAKHGYAAEASSEELKLVIRAVKRDVDRPCKLYVPSVDYGVNEPRPKCECGRPALSHLPSVMIAGIKAWRNRDKPCGQFQAIKGMPGNCVVCSQTWIDHAPRNRGLVVEEYWELHDTWCKCIISTGAVECSCMTPKEIQATLDKVFTGTAQKKAVKKMCKRFKSKSTGAAVCQCGEQFYRHSLEAKGGFDVWTDWHQANMTDHEVAKWILTLGRNRQEAIEVLGRIIKDPNFQHISQISKICPDMRTIAAAYEAITGEHILRSKNDKRGLVKEDILSDDTSKPVLCFGCGEMTSKEEGKPCETCSGYYRAEGSEPNATDRRWPNQVVQPAATGNAKAEDKPGTT